MSRFWLLIVFIGISLAVRGSNVDSLIKELDEAIAKRPQYVLQKEKHLEELKEKLQNEKNPRNRFELLGELYTEYNFFNTDSVLMIVKERQKLAKELDDVVSNIHATLNWVEVLSTTGMFKEALDCMVSVDRENIPDFLLPYYYHLYRTIYGYMSDYAVDDTQKKYYDRLTDTYRDSILLVNDPKSSTHIVVLADKLNEAGEMDKAISLVEQSFLVNPHNFSEHEQAIITYTLSESYRLKGETEKQKEYLLQSAIADMTTATMEYVSLRNLAVILYQEDDIDRAYSYLKMCMEDASNSNTRLRMVEIQKIFPVINDVYQENKMAQQKKLKVMLLLISLLSIVLICSLFYWKRQMKKLAAARKQVVDANEQLTKLNEELSVINKKLKDTNHSLVETTYLKETYIGRYMDQCSAYIEKMDAYRKSLSKIALTGKMADLVSKIKSSQFIDDELKSFYANFDDTFLSLFPTFVEDFNELLIESERVVLKPNERMNTELRIFALVRLGITDSVKIAQFLRYSVSTIYNYRTKARNKALGNRDDFEKKVAHIGKFVEIQ